MTAKCQKLGRNWNRFLESVEEQMADLEALTDE